MTPLRGLSRTFWGSQAAAATIVPVMTGRSLFSGQKRMSVSTFQTRQARIPRLRKFLSHFSGHAVACLPFLQHCRCGPRQVEWRGFSCFRTELPVVRALVVSSVSPTPHAGAIICGRLFSSCRVSFAGAALPVLCLLCSHASLKQTETSLTTCFFLAGRLKKFSRLSQCVHSFSAGPASSFFSFVCELFFH